MQDLGNINITIRGGTQGGTSGSGQPGGGPAAVPSSPSVAMVPQSVSVATATAPTSAAATATAAAQAAQATQEAKPSRFETLMERLTQGSDIRSEIGAFLRSPSVGGLASLGQSSTTTGRALTALTAKFAAAGPIAIGLLAAVGGVAIGLGMLRGAAEMTARRIEETMRFSGVMQFQAGIERFAQFQRTINDLNLNGARYAQSQRLATAVNNAQAAAMSQFNGIIAEAGQTWQKLQLGFFTLVELIGKGVNIVKGLFNYLGITMDELVLGSISPFAPLAFDWLKGPMMKILEYLGLINANTRPQNAGSSVNNWFYGDLAAMTRHAPNAQPTAPAASFAGAASSRTPAGSGFQFPNGLAANRPRSR